MIIVVVIIIVIIIWIRGLHADREVVANMPHIKFRNKREKTCILMDAVVPADRNVT
jgi:hypothetical protein